MQTKRQPTLPLESVLAAHPRHHTQRRVAEERVTRGTYMCSSGVNLLKEEWRGECDTRRCEVHHAWGSRDASRVSGLAADFASGEGG